MPRPRAARPPNAHAAWRPPLKLKTPPSAVLGSALSLFSQSTSMPREREGEGEGRSPHAPRHRLLLHLALGRRAAQWNTQTQTQTQTQHKACVTGHMLEREAQSNERHYFLYICDDAFCPARSQPNFWTESGRATHECKDTLSISGPRLGPPRPGRVSRRSLRVAFGGGEQGEKGCGNRSFGTWAQLAQSGYRFVSCWS